MHPSHIGSKVCLHLLTEGSERSNRIPCAPLSKMLTSVCAAITNDLSALRSATKVDEGIPTDTINQIAAAPAPVVSPEAIPEGAGHDHSIEKQARYQQAAAAGMGGTTSTEAAPGAVPGFGNVGVGLISTPAGTRTSGGVVGTTTTSATTSTTGSAKGGGVAREPHDRKLAFSTVGTPDYIAPEVGFYNT